MTIYHVFSELPDGPVFGLNASTVEVMGLIPGWGPVIPNAAWYSKNK